MMMLTVRFVDSERDFGKERNKCVKRQYEEDGNEGTGFSDGLLIMEVTVTEFLMRSSWLWIRSLRAKDCLKVLEL
jgi:hypothetical protein